MLCHRQEKRKKGGRRFQKSRRGTEGFTSNKLLVMLCTRTNSCKARSAVLCCASEKRKKGARKAQEVRTAQGHHLPLDQQQFAFVLPTKSCNLFHKALSKAHIPLIIKPGEKGFEPLTFGFGNHYSTVETILLTSNLLLIRRNPFAHKKEDGDPVLCCAYLVCKKYAQHKL